MGWTEAHDNASGYPYWINEETQETSWDPPPPACDGGGEWEQQTDPHTGAVYYWNADDDRVSWTIPPGWESSAAASERPPPPAVAADEDDLEERPTGSIAVSFSDVHRASESQSFSSGTNPLHGNRAEPSTAPSKKPPVPSAITPEPHASPSDSSSNPRHTAVRDGNGKAGASLPPPRRDGSKAGAPPSPRRDDSKVDAKRRGGVRGGDRGLVRLLVAGVALGIVLVAIGAVLYLVPSLTEPDGGGQAAAAEQTTAAVAVELSGISCSQCA